uniref:Uncharacterized protein n=1 Tax=Mesocestoides corti TaxID=53468 RepID=A0A5K3G1X4_MESCO
MPQPILCLSAFQWHARKISSQPEKDTNKRRGQRRGLGWKANDLWLWLGIGQ